jgi:soluble P-type ATPase
MREVTLLDIAIPGAATLNLEHLALDFNGTLAVDGALVSGVAEALRHLASRLDIHVLTADTFGTARAALAGLPTRLVVLPPGQHDEAKRRHVEQLGADRCVAIGNGHNDRLLLEAAALGIVVVQLEGAALPTLLAADVVVPDIVGALALLLHPSRLIATLRR